MTSNSSCELCRSAEEMVRLLRHPTLPVAQCRSCGLAQVNPLPTPAELENIYASQDKYQQEQGPMTWFKHDPVKLNALWSDRLSTLERFAPRGHVLDIGCGFGDFLDYARSKGWRVTGTEYSPQQLAVARAKFGLDDLYLGDITSVSKPDETFDAATMWHVLEHLPHPVAVLHEIHRLLKPLGYLALEVPNLNFFIRKSYYMPQEKTLHLYHFSEFTLSRMLQLVGFQVLAIGPGNTGNLVEQPIKWLAKQVASIIARLAYSINQVNVSDTIRVVAIKRGNWSSPDSSVKVSAT